MPCLRGLGLPRHFHMGIEFICMNHFFPVQMREEQGQVKVISQNACLFLFTFLVKARFQREMRKSKSAPTLHGMKDPTFHVSLRLQFIKGEEEKHFTWGHLSYCSFFLCIIFIFCYCYKIPQP